MKRYSYLILLFLASALVLSYDVPNGWFKAGSQPDKYDMGLDKGAGRDGSDAATIKSDKRKIDGFGTLMQNFGSKKFVGKRVQLTGYLRSENVESWAGLWMRVDAADGKTMLSFDNMSTRPIKGTTSWTACSIVLDVPETAANIAYGALLSGTGQIWFDDLDFKIVDSSVPTTDQLNTPSNTNFDK